MYNNFKKLFALLISFATVFSCKENVNPETYLSIEPTEVTISREGDTFLAQITSTYDFNVTIPEDSKWITMINSESAPDFKSFKVNPTGVKRTGMVLFSCAEDTDTLFVYQNGDSPDNVTAFLQNETPGFYFKAEAGFTYEDQLYQYSRTFKSETTDFRITKCAEAKYMIVSDLPTSAEPHQYYTLTVKQNFSFTTKSDFTSQFFMEKTENGKIWLYDYTNEYGIILINE